MIFSVESILFVGSILLLLSIGLSKMSDRLGIPALLLFLGLGMMAGSEGVGGIHFDNAYTAQVLGVLSLAFILFSGGLDTRWRDIKPALGQGLLLSTIGVFLTAGVLAVSAVFFFDFTWLEAMLLGAIVSSTDAAAVFSILRSKRLGLKGNLRPTLELESGSNDPMAYFLMIAVITMMTVPGSSPIGLIPTLMKHVFFGLLVGGMMGKAMAWILNHIRLTYFGLYPVLMLALVLLTYSMTALVGGNAFLAVYISGLVLGNTFAAHKRNIVKFYDGVAWLMQIAMFLTLGLLVYPSELLPVLIPGIALSLVLMFVARPAAVFLSFAFVRISIKEKLFLSWTGLRGAVPIVFATFPLLAEIPNADKIFHIVFFIVLTSILFQGTSFAWVAKALRLDNRNTGPNADSLEDWAEHTSDQLQEIYIRENSFAAGKTIASLGLSQKVLIVSIKREDKTLVPNGQLQLEVHDMLLVMGSKQELMGLL